MAENFANLDEATVDDVLLNIRPANTISASTVLPKDSFFRLDPTYDASNKKVLPSSQEISTSTSSTELVNTSDRTAENTANKPGFSCDKCNRCFSTKSGRTNHQNKCKGVNQQTSVASEHNGRETIALPIETVSKALIWGSHSLEDVEQIINSVYEEIVYWRQNLFLLPSGAAGKSFVRETTRLLDIWNGQVHPMKNIAIKVTMIMPALLLQKPSYKSTAKQHGECLARRMELWSHGEFNKLITEARTIQSKPPKFNSIYSSAEQLAKTFSKLMLQGKVNAALRLLDKNKSAGVLNLTEDTLKELQQKHPEASSADPTMLISGDIPFVDPVLYSNINESTIMKAALRTKGAAGPSGMNADAWRRILVSKNYGKSGTELRKSIAAMARNLATKEIEPCSKSIESYTACRLIPLDKNPGVRPIGVGEVLRRIIGKSIIAIIKPEILESAGSLQLCAGLPAGCEAAAHAMTDIYNEENTDALLLVDANNAFNSLNRTVLLHNIKYICPAMATYVRNCYATPSRLFVTGGKEIASSEGTTQGDPFAMPAYAVGIVPLLPLLREQSNAIENKVKHTAYADDLAGAGTLRNLKEWWLNVAKYGPLLGYHPKASKSWIIVKETKIEEAKKVFQNTEINITSSGHKYLGTYIGTETGRDIYVKKLVSSWQEEIRILSQIALSEPQAAYAAFTSGYKHKLSYYIRTTPNIAQHLKDLDDAINFQFIPAITEGHMCTRDERQLLSLPVKLGGMGIPIFAEMCEKEYHNSKRITTQLSLNIKEQHENYRFETAEYRRTMAAIKQERVKSNQTILCDLQLRMSPEQLRGNELAQMKGASTWLTSLPLQSENFVLNKREFHDGVRMRYRLELRYLPSTCACGKQFTVDHAMSCLKGGYIHQRHDEVRDILAKLSEEISKDIEVEPHLQPLTGEILPHSSNDAEEARLDLSIRGFWQRGQRAFFDVRVFNPFAPTYRCQKLTNVFSSNEKAKKRSYGKRVIEIEHGSFTPLIFTPYGGCGRESERFLSVLSKKISDKRDIAQSIVMTWIRSVMSFALLRSAILCVRGSRNQKRKHEFDLGNIEIIQAECKIP